MKKYFLILFLFTVRLAAIACPACEAQQPKILRGITHGTGPKNNWDYIIVWIAAIVVLATLYFSVKWLIRPGEKGADHIKRFILNFE
jgi:uncharacterized protein HemY